MVTLGENASECIHNFGDEGLQVQQQSEIVKGSIHRFGSIILILVL